MFEVQQPCRGMYWFAESEKVSHMRGQLMFRVSTTCREPDFKEDSKKRLHLRRSKRHGPLNDETRAATVAEAAGVANAREALPRFRGVMHRRVCVTSDQPLDRTDIVPPLS